MKNNIALLTHVLLSILMINNEASTLIAGQRKDYRQQRCSIGEITRSLHNKNCVPCESGIEAFTLEQEIDYCQAVPLWSLDRTAISKIYREFIFKDFKTAMAFVNEVAQIAEDEGHHPDITIFYNRVELTLYTHAIKGLSENDFIIATRVDSLLLNKNL